MIPTAVNKSTRLGLADAADAWTFHTMSYVDTKTRELQAPSTATILRNYVDPKDDMAAERARATFDVQQLTEVLVGGKEVLEKR